MQRSKIKDIFARTDIIGEVLVQGWVKTRRSSKTVSFLQLNDGSTLRDIQVVVDESNLAYSAAGSLTTGCSVSVVGTVVESPGKGQTERLGGSLSEVHPPGRQRPIAGVCRGFRRRLGGRLRVRIHHVANGAPH